MSSSETKTYSSATHLKQLLDIQQDVIEKIALSTELSDILTFICSNIETIFESTHAMSSVLLLKGNQLHHGAAPSLPKAYCDIIDEVEIGESVGSCGTAAFSKQRYIASDISSDPKWANFKGVAKQFGFAACWSTPIFSTESKVLGTFALYYDKPRFPTVSELEVIDRFSHLTGLAIEKHYAYKREVSLNQKLKLSHGKVEAMAKVLPDQVFIFDEDAHCVDYYGSDIVRRYSPKKNLLGRLINRGDIGIEHCSCHEAIARSLQSDSLQVFEYKIQFRQTVRYYESRISPIDGYASANSNRKHVLWLARDITERKESEAKIEELAYHDLLTSLPNRRYLLNQLQTTIGELSDSKQFGALLYLDLDNFKGVNDSLGHSAGDSLLKDICTRLSMKLDQDDTFCRIGGDEFVVILSGYFEHMQNLEQHSANVAQNLLSQLEKPFALCGREVVIEASIGITVISDQDSHADEILMCADTAMYAAKRDPSRGFCFFDPALHESLKKRFELENELKEAIKLKQITTHFQPQIGAQGELKGAEALVRWEHPERGMISPLEFISIAEEIGVIGGLQKIVMEDSCMLLRTLRSSGLIDQNFKLSINVSAIQFKNMQLCDELALVFNEQNVSPKDVTLELTESMLVEEIESVVKQMNTLKQLGFCLSIDDFGTGYSSLAYLQSFPIDELKIDKSFVDNMQSHQVGTGIVETIISLAAHLNFNVVAEGVEQQSQAEFFRKLNIDAMQGYFFSRPMTADDFCNWIPKLKPKQKAS